MNPFQGCSSDTSLAIGRARHGKRAPGARWLPLAGQSGQLNTLHVSETG
jgi:hypothetical protein